MRKTIPKLVLRTETVRTLATVDLMRVQGGSDANAAQAIAESTPKQCAAAIVAAVATPGG